MSLFGFGVLRSFYEGMPPICTFYTPFHTAALQRQLFKASNDVDCVRFHNANHTAFGAIPTCPRWRMKSVLGLGASVCRERVAEVTRKHHRNRKLLSRTMVPTPPHSARLRQSAKSVNEGPFCRSRTSRKMDPGRGTRFLSAAD